MKIVSFAWTTPAVLIARHPNPDIAKLAKDTTRRDWDPEYAVKFREGELFQGWNMSQRVHGQRFGTCRLLQKDESGDLPEEDYRREGFEYLSMRGIRSRGMADKQMNGLTPVELWQFWQRTEPIFRLGYILRFELMDLTPFGEQLLAAEVDALANWLDNGQQAALI